MDSLPVILVELILVGGIIGLALWDLRSLARERRRREAQREQEREQKRDADPACAPDAKQDQER